MAGRPKTRTGAGRKESLETVEKKIEKTKARVVRAKAEYEAATQELKDLMDKRDLLRQDAIVKMLMASKRSYEEIEAFLKEEPSVQD